MRRNRERREKAEKLQLTVGITIQRYQEVMPSSLLKLMSLFGCRHAELDKSIFDDIDSTSKFMDSKFCTVKQTAIHLPYGDGWQWDLGDQKEKHRTDQLLSNLNNHHKALKLKFAIVHPASPQSSKDLFFESLGKINSDIKICLENVPEIPLTDFIGHYNDLVDILDRKIGICFDIPHSYVQRGEEKYLDLPKEFTANIRYVHFSDADIDANGNRIDAHLPINHGVINWEEVYRFLEDIQFHGTINLECLPRSINDIPKVVDSYLSIVRRISKIQYLKSRTAVAILKPFVMRKFHSLNLPQPTFNE